MTKIETERLLLRPFEDRDVAPYIAIRAKREVARYLPRAPETEREAWARQLFAAFNAAWKERGYGPWAAVDKASGALIGHMGLRYMPEFDETEMLYAFDTPFWGRGLASEGAAASLRFGFEVVGLSKIMAIAIPKNAASRKVMTKHGLEFQRMADYKGFEVAYHAIDRATWLAQVQASPKKAV